MPHPTYDSDSFYSLVIQVGCPVLAREIEQHAYEIVLLSSRQLPRFQVSMLLNDGIENLVKFAPQL